MAPMSSRRSRSGARREGVAVEAREQIRAEGSARCEGLERLVRRRDDAKVYGHRPRCADRDDLSLLQHAQKSGLRPGAADRPPRRGRASRRPTRGRTPARHARHRRRLLWRARRAVPPRAPAGIAPQLTATKGPGRPDSCVHRPRDHLLARARLAAQQDGDLRRRNVCESVDLRRERGDDRHQAARARCRAACVEVERRSGWAVHRRPEQQERVTELDDVAVAQHRVGDRLAVDACSVARPEVFDAEVASHALDAGVPP